MWSDPGRKVCTVADDLISFEGVGFAYGATPVLTDLDVRVPADGITAVAGPSGSGKSTLLRLANRLLLPDRGTVRHRGIDVATIPPPTLRRRLGMVFQRPSPFPGSVRDNLAVAAPDLTDDQARRLMARVGLAADLLDREASDLSGGQLQRMCLARALATEPESLLLDEPSTALDPAARHGIEQLARSLAEAGTPLVWVTHDLEQLRRVADHVVLLMNGRARMSGSVADLDAAARSDPKIAAFLAETPPEAREDADER
ncbi:MAG: ATP-binding cassette domain-containing protein [Micromonosporaceae bacterium]|nr:ATP-binding cassette domain-containing protein [Micromonosporaceae bacterium]